MIKPGQWKWLWGVDFPLVEWDEETKRDYALHHPFTAPHPDDLDKMDSDPANVRSLAYDLVLNGSELGGGSIHIHRPDVQQKAFEVLGIDKQEARAKFGFLLEMHIGCQPIARARPRPTKTPPTPPPPHPPPRRR